MSEKKSVIEKIEAIDIFKDMPTKIGPLALQKPPPHDLMILQEVMMGMMLEHNKLVTMVNLLVKDREAQVETIKAMHETIMQLFKNDAAIEQQKTRLGGIDESLDIISELLEVHSQQIDMLATGQHREQQEVKPEKINVNLKDFDGPND
jgi:hypothetical protein